MWQNTGVLIGLFLAAALSVCLAENEILGCGGFIKSHAEIDFSKIEVKL